MNTNNAILFTFLIIFLSLALVSPYIAEEFNNDINEVDYDSTINRVLDTDITATTLLLFNLLFIPLWTFGLPAWANLIFLVPLRIVFIVILYDKFRGI